MTIMMDEDNVLQEEEKPVELSEGQIRDFVEHPVWKELVSTLEQRIEICNSNLATMTVLNDILKEQGEVLALRSLLNGPALIFQDIKIEAEKAQLQQDTGDQNV